MASFSQDFNISKLPKYFIENVTAYEELYYKWLAAE